MQYVFPIDGSTSDMFWDSQAHAFGNLHVECRCGIQHFAINSRYIEPEDEPIPDEIDTGDYRVKHHFDCDSIQSARFVGQVLVRECVGCSEFLRRYEDFIWNERDTIRNYLKMRIDQEKRWADQEHMKNILAGIIPFGG